MNTHTHQKQIVLGRAMRGLLEMQAECSVCGGVGISVFSRLDIVRG